MSTRHKNMLGDPPACPQGLFYFPKQDTIFPNQACLRGSYFLLRNRSLALGPPVPPARRSRFPQPQEASSPGAKMCGKLPWHFELFIAKLPWHLAVFIAKLPWRFELLIVNLPWHSEWLIAKLRVPFGLLMAKLPWHFELHIPELPCCLKCVLHNSLCI